jgi:hypothetical protein
MAVHQRVPGRGGAAAAALALLLLSACAGAPPPGGSPATPAVAVTPPPPAETATPPATPSVAIVPPVPAEPASPPQQVERLIGLRGDHLREWMGDTVFVRHDGIAEIWRFAADTCFLDVFLYREADGLRVAHLDARPRSGNQRVLPQSCYGRILASRQRAS